MKHIDNLFKEKLYNHEASVPEGMWEKIAPIAEEESGRALIWFWFAGLLALALGAYGIYNMIDTDSPKDPTTLAYEDQIQSPNLSVNNSLTANEKILPETISEEVIEAPEKSTEHINKKQASDIKSKPIASISKQSSNASLGNTPVQPKKNQGVNNTVENLTNVEGVPTNLVITKSYINKEGSIIKQSNLSTNLGNEGPVYDIIINSEVKDLNAGALLRIVEPLENIPLPSFQKTLKKKTLTTLF
jgi:hypothetical protein